MKLKVCGLSNPIEIETCVSLNINYCGFILNFPKSHRHISFNKASELTKINKGKTKYVGVLVEPTIEQLNRFSELNFDYFQLYGNFHPDELMNIKEKFKKKIISSVQVKKKQDIDNYKIVESSSDIILWDSSGYEESLSWDFNWLKTVSTKIEKMVAGNITIDKIKNLVNLADTIDVSGALETNKVKDINKIKQFIAEIKKVSYEN
jgi:phosphoribosylanthranilate isomerase